MTTALLAGLVLLADLATAPAQKGKGNPVKPLQSWQGKLKDEALRKAAPSSGLIARAKDFEDLWKAWRGSEKVPQVDFQKELALIMTAGGPNRVTIMTALDEKGNLKATGIATLIGGPGFGYQIITVSRAGIRTVNGKEVPAP
jgi:hypothetical protein